MSPRLVLAACLLLSACSLLGKDESDDDDDGTGSDIGDSGDGGFGDAGSSDGGSSDGGSGDGGDDCEIRVDETRPVDGQVDVYIRTDITFELGGPIPAAEIRVAEDGEGAVEGELSWSGEDTVVFTPDAPLKTSTAYTATLDYCGGEAAISFSTSDLGEPLTSSVRGNSYILNLAGATFVEPPGVGDLLLSSLENDLLVAVTAQTSTTLDLMISHTVAEGREQDLCAETVDLPTADFSASPYWELGPTDLAFTLGGLPLVFSNTTLSGTFAADGTWYGGSVLQTQLDARILAVAMGDLLGTDDPSSICELVAGFGITCEPCASDDAPYCIALHITDVVAEEWDDTLVERSAADIRSDPDCK